MKIYEVTACIVGKRMRDSSIHRLHTDPGTEIPMAYYFWGLRSGEEFIPVDTGFPLECASRRGAELTDYRSPRDLLKTLDVDPTRVRRVILTHLHWDHCGGLDLFPNALFFVQKRDIEFYTGPFSGHPALKAFVEMDSLLQLLRWNHEGRVVVLDGDRRMDDGLDLIHAGGHTPGSQMVRVRTGRGPVLITGDVVPLYANWSDSVPPGIYSHLEEVLRAYERMKGMVETLDDIIPGHDPGVAERFAFIGPVGRVA